MCGEGNLIPDDQVWQRNKECLAEKQGVFSSSIIPASAPQALQGLILPQDQQHIPAVSRVPAPASVWWGNQFRN